jgi:MoxR-like ATPase
MEVLFSHNDRHPYDDLQSVVSCQEIIELQEQVKKVRVDRAVAEYALRLIDATRSDPRIRLAISPRGSLTLYRTAQARARLLGRDHALPEDVRALVVPVLAHRIMLDTKAKFAGILPRHLLDEALEKVPVPR